MPYLTLAISKNVPEYQVSAARCTCNHGFPSQLHKSRKDKQLVALKFVVALSATMHGNCSSCCDALQLKHAMNTQAWRWAFFVPGAAMVIISMLVLSVAQVRGLVHNLSER